MGIGVSASAPLIRTPRSHVSPKHEPSYLASFAYRFNRSRQLDSIVERLAWAAAHTLLQPCRIVTADA